VSSLVPNTGQALIWDGNIWKPQFPGAPGMSSITVKSGAFSAPTSVLNLVAGSGFLINVLDTGTETRVQPALDTAVVVTNTRLQSGEALFCSAEAGASDHYTCSLDPAPAAYQTGMVLYWRPLSTPIGNAVTLAVGSLASKAVKLNDGHSDPAAGDILAGHLYPLWFDGSVFRLSTSPGIGGNLPRPACDVLLRGRFWQVPGDTGAKDEVAVCAKDGADQYDWRPLY
jgi:hypothetical protein